MGKTLWDALYIYIYTYNTVTTNILYLNKNSYNGWIFIVREVCSNFKINKL